VFTIAVANPGSGPATGVKLTDPLPSGAGLSWTIDSQSPGAPCTISAGSLVCELGDLPSGASFNATVGSTTTSASCGTYTNTATATATNRSGADASATTTVQCIQQTYGGCSPGFWKQQKQFIYWMAPYTPSTFIGSVFSAANSYATDKDARPIATQTLLQGLEFRGGNSIGGAAEILTRAAVAAVLNAANPTVNYPRSKTDVIASVNIALASGNRSTILALASGLDTDNNLQCTAK
jgi:hypothetical protein